MKKNNMYVSELYLKTLHVCMFFPPPSLINHCKPSQSCLSVFECWMMIFDASQDTLFCSHPDCSLVLRLSICICASGRRRGCNQRAITCTFTCLHRRLILERNRTAGPRLRINKQRQAQAVNMYFCAFGVGVSTRVGVCRLTVGYIHFI